MTSDTSFFRQRNGLTIALYWVIRIWMAVAVLLFLTQADFASAAGTFILLILIQLPSLLSKKYRFYFPYALDVSMGTFVFLTLFLGLIARFYDRLPFWDTMLHFQSGLLFGATGFLLVYFLNGYGRSGLNLTPGFISLFAISFSIAIGALWEIGEFVADIYTGASWSPSLEDTIVDLIADSTGALIISILGYFWMRHYNRLPLAPWLKIFTKKHD
jgi:hypothetical protein